MLNGKKILLKLFVRNSRSCRAPESERAGCVGGGDPLVARPGPEPAVHVNGLLLNNLFSKHTTHYISLKFSNERFEHFLKILPGKCCPRTPFPWSCTSCPRCRWTQSCLGGKAKKKTNLPGYKGKGKQEVCSFFFNFFGHWKVVSPWIHQLKTEFVFLDREKKIFVHGKCLPEIRFSPFFGCAFKALLIFLRSHARTLGGRLPATKRNLRVRLFLFGHL